MYKHKNKRGTFQYMMNRAKSLAIPPERVDGLLHSEPLRNTTPPLSAGALEAKTNMERAKKLKEEQDMQVAKTIGEQLREKLDAVSKREALNNTLNEWDADEQKQIKGEVMTAQPKHLFGVTNNASRETFYFIKDNPNLGIADIKAGMVARGFKESTVSSLAYQMVVAGLCAKSNIDHTFIAIADEFTPFNVNKIRRELKLKQQAEDKEKMAAFAKRDENKKVVQLKRKQGGGFEVDRSADVAGIGALAVKTDVSVDGHKIGTFKQHAPWKPEDTVDQLTLVQAKAVHAYLQQVFGAL